MGPLRGPGERGVDEVPEPRDDEYGERLDSAGLLFHFHFITEPLGLFDVLFEQQQQVVSQAFEERVAFLGRRRTGP